MKFAFALPFFSTDKLVVVSDLKTALWLRAEPWRMPSLRWTMIGAGILFTGGMHYAIPITQLHLHNILQHLYYLPIVFAGIYFGWRGGLTTALLAGISSLPYSLRLMDVMPAYAGDQLLDIVVFCAAGVFTGILSERGREQRIALERTTAKLTEVYRELQDSFEQVKRAERLSAAGQLSAGLAHEIRNPLASLAGAAGVLKRGQASQKTRTECVEIIERESGRLNRLLTEFLSFARPRTPQIRAVNLHTILEPVIELAAHAVGSKAVRIRRDLNPSMPSIECDPEQIQQAVLNLLLNAVQASPDSGEVVVSTKVQDGRILIQVRSEEHTSELQSRQY